MNYEEFKKQMDAQYGLFWHHIKKVAIRSALRMEAMAKINATTYPRSPSGRLRSSILGESKIDGGELVISIQAGGQGGGQPVNYAGFVEFGTKDPVTPRLFFSPSIGWRYATKGIKPRYYLARAAQAEQPVLKKELGSAIKLTLQGKK